VIERKRILAPNNHRFNVFTPYGSSLEDLSHLLGKINERQGLQMRTIIFANATHV
jgi:hypothetical protein